MRSKSKETIKEYVRYDEWFKQSMKEYVQKAYTPAYRKGWYVKEIIKTEEGWLVKWERTIV